jgi:hypothetical protein
MSMSANNAIAILITHDRWFETQKNHFERLGQQGQPVWRVAHIVNPEQFEELRKYEIHNLGHWMYNTFGNSPTFLNADDAMEYARQEAEQHIVLEHGIITYDARPYNFPDR